MAQDPEQVSVFKKLESLRVIVLMGTVGAMHTTLMAFLGILLAVRSLHLDMARDVYLCITLRSHAQWKMGARNSKIPFLDEPLLQGMRTDFIPQCSTLG